MKTEFSQKGFVPEGFEGTIPSVWQSPSNIALTKYWGKKEGQIPANPSISFTLSECRAITSLFIKDKAGKDAVNIYYDGILKESFKPKVENLLNKMSGAFPILKQKSYAINTLNTFPHSSGIASSASGMSALALCICDFLKNEGQITEDDFFRTVSYWSRIGSGSACRSIYGGFTAWGASYSLATGSDEYAVPLTDIHPDLHRLCDYIMLVDEGEKSLDSTAGHGLMNEHPHAKARYENANRHFSTMLKLLKAGDIWALGELIESEALELHAMMMTSARPFWLMKPGTIAILEKIRSFRKQNELPLFFTLDAGANVHCIFPESIENQVLSLVENELKSACANGVYIRDRIGAGPMKLNHV